MYGENSTLIVTQGNKPVLKFNDAIQGYSIQEEYPVIDVEAFDVCGAGDTFLSSLTFEFLRTGVINNAIKFAIKASSVTIKHFGVYAPTLEERNACFAKILLFLLLLDAT